MGAQARAGRWKPALRRVTLRRDARHGAAPGNGIEAVPNAHIDAEAVNDRAKLILHRLAARRLARAPETLDLARAEIAARRARDASGRAEFLDEWDALLAAGPAVVRRKLVERTETMRRLRLSTPFALLAGMTDPDFRRRVWRRARAGLVRTDA